MITLLDHFRGIPCNESDFQLVSTPEYENCLRISLSDYIAKHPELYSINTMKISMMLFIGYNSINNKAEYRIRTPSEQNTFIEGYVTYMHEPRTMPNTRSLVAVGRTMAVGINVWSLTSFHLPESKVNDF